MLIAGLTGNYGMGKSYVLSLFKDLGAVTIESDRIVDEILREARVVDNIKRLLGPEVLGKEGNLDKSAVAKKIFNDPALRRNVEALLHPLVLEKVDRFIENIRDRDSIVLVEVPLLFEGNYGRRFRKVITVYTNEETALQRLEAAGIPRQEAMLRLKAQMPVDRKKELADYTIDNSGRMQETRQRAAEIYALLLEDMKKER